MPASYVVALSCNETDLDKVQIEQTHDAEENCINSSIKPMIIEPTSNSKYFIINDIINDIFEEIDELEKDNDTKNSKLDARDVKTKEKEQRNFTNEKNCKNLFESMQSTNSSTDTIICNRSICQLSENPSNSTLKKSNTTESSHNDLKNNTSSSVINLSIINSSINNFSQINEVHMENDNITRVNSESLSNFRLEDSKLISDSKHCGEIEDTDTIKSNNSSTVKDKPSNLYYRTGAPYTTCIINMAVAQVGNHTIVKEILASHSTEKLLNESMISTKTVVNEKSDLTSTAIMETKDSVSNIFNENNFRGDSDATLVGSIPSQISSKNENFFLASTGSSLNKTDESSYTITTCSDYCSSSNTEIIEKNLVPIFKDQNNNIPNVPPEPSISNVDQYKFHTNNVVIAEGLQKIYPLKSKGDNLSLNKFSKNVLKKSLGVVNSGTLKNITLPNEATIKEIITERENSQKISCSEESRNLQLFPEIWEKLTVTLDLAIKKLEESLSEKILRELKMTLQKFERYAQLISNEETKIKQSSIETPDLNKTEAGTLELNNDESMQCDLIQSHIIDNLIQKKLSTDQKPVSTTKVLNKTRLPKISKDNFEILKAYTEPLVVKQLGDGDSVKISADGVSLSPTRTRILFQGPLRFLRENYFVISSVPAFFLCVFLIYGFIVLLIKLW